MSSRQRRNYIRFVGLFQERSAAVLQNNEMERRRLKLGNSSQDAINKLVATIVIRQISADESFILEIGQRIRSRWVDPNVDERQRYQ